MSGGAKSQALEQVRSLEGERDAILGALTPVIDGIAATFGPMCEVVLHDYRRPERSVVAVAGAVTGRAVGGAMSEIGMRMVARGEEATDELNHVTRTREAGQIVKSSTMLLRDSTGAVFGAVCVNLDVSAVTEAHALLGVLGGIGSAPAELPVTVFGNDIDSVVEVMLDSHRSGRDRPWAALDRRERLELFRDLDERGVFAVRRAIEQVATRLGISRASAYSYLSRSRAANDPPPEPRRPAGPPLSPDSVDSPDSPDSPGIPARDGGHA